MAPSRREVLGGSVGALVALLLSPPARADGDALVAHVREKLLNFDGARLVRRAAEDLGLPRRWRRRLDEALDQVDLSGGLRRLQDLEPSKLRPLLRLGEDALDSLGFKLWLLRLTKRIPEERDARVALIEHMLTEWFELDMEALREGVRAIDADGLAIVYGPISDIVEATGILLHEPFALFLQLVHGRRATEHFLEEGDTARALLDVLLSPKPDVVVLIGHGTWTSFQLVGYSRRPRQLLDDVLDRLHDEPREGLNAVAKGALYYLYKRRVPRGALQEEDLARLFDQVYPAGPERERRLKTLVVRHTCGSERYATEGAELLWKMAPKAVEDTIELDGDHFSAATPSGRLAFEAALGGWLADMDVPIVERPAFGTCLVRDPTATRGYEGISWMADFLEEPVPAHLEPAAFVSEPSDEG